MPNVGPMIRVEFEHIKHHMIAAIHEHSEEIRKEANRQVEAMLGNSAFEETVAKTIEKELNSALREYVARVISRALAEHEGAMKAMVMEHVAKLMAEDQIKQLMRE